MPPILVEEKVRPSCFILAHIAAKIALVQLNKLTYIGNRCKLETRVTHVT